MKMPTVSVLMPAYNSEKYIGEAIDSILNQSMQDFEFIIINDGSTDKTEQIIKLYDSDKIRYFVNDKNIGIAKTYNRAISLAKGKYLAIAESDDINHPKRLEILSNYLDTHPKVGVVSSKILEFKGAPPAFSKKNMSNKISHSSMYIKCNAAFAVYKMKHASKMMRASVLAEHRVTYDDRYRICCDFALFMELVKITNMVYFKSHLVLYRRHGENKSGNDINKQKAEVNDIANRFLHKEYGLDLNLVYFSSRISKISDFNEYVDNVKMILYANSGNKEYDSKTLRQAAANCCYRSFRHLYDNDVDRQTIFETYRRTPIMRHMDRVKKFRVYRKHIAYKIGF